MSNSTLASFSSLQTLVNTILQSGGADSSFNCLTVAKAHSYELGIGLLTAIVGRYMYKIVKGANTFAELDGPQPASLMWGT
jgi:hypothetical protein